MVSSGEDEHDGRPPWGRAGERPGAPKADDQLADQGVKRRPPAATTAQAVQTWVDQSIAQAERQGAFDNLSGAGKPLRDVDTNSDPDWWVRSLIERERLDLSAAMPGVMQLRREKAALPESLLEVPDEATVRARLEDFNERVLADRRRPHVGAGSPPIVGRVDVEEMVQAWRSLRAEGRERGESGDEGQRDERVTRDRAHRRPRWWKGR
jgi:hypothetical protein